MKMRSLLTNILAGVTFTTISMMDDACATQNHTTQGPFSIPDDGPCGDVALNLELFKARIGYDDQLRKFKENYPDAYQHYEDLLKKNEGAEFVTKLPPQRTASHGPAISKEATEELEKILELKNRIKVYETLKAKKAMPVGSSHPMQSPTPDAPHSAAH